MSRGNGHARVFHDERDYSVFVSLMRQASDRIPMRIAAWCLMPNHFHFVLWPIMDGDLGRWMHWLLTSHVRRHHKRYDTDGHIWQGRFKAPPIQQDRHLLSVLRYTECNPLRARLVDRPEGWRWSSLHQWERTDPMLPLQSPIERAKNLWRQQILVRTAGRRRLVRAIDRVLAEIEGEIPRRAIQVDVDPLSVL